MSKARLLSRVLIEPDVRVRCGIGHRVHAAVYKATYRYVDMDGEPMTPFDTEEYEPRTCVVCGLLLWGRTP